MNYREGTYLDANNQLVYSWFLDHPATLYRQSDIADALSMTSYRQGTIQAAFKTLVEKGCLQEFPPIKGDRSKLYTLSKDPPYYYIAIENRWQFQTGLAKLI